MILLVAAACSPASPVETAVPVPTQPLIPVDPSATPVPPTVTPSLEPRLRPADLLTPTVASSGTVMRDVVVADAAERAETSTQAVMVVEANPRLWRDEQTFNCPSTETDSATPGATISGFEFLLLVDDRVFLYHTDDIDTLKLCFSEDVSEVTGELLLSVDAVASESFELASRQVAERLDLPPRRVELVEFRVVTWPDNSLGCPVAGQAYVQVPVYGYRMILAAGDSEFIFHADIDGIVECDPEDVVLPEDLNDDAA